jgi:hypothetical protein
LIKIFFLIFFVFFYKYFFNDFVGDLPLVKGLVGGPPPPPSSPATTAAAAGWRIDGRDGGDAHQLGAVIYII